MTCLCQLISGLRKDDFLTAKIAPIFKMVMNCELGMMWEEATEVSFKVLSPDFIDWENEKECRKDN